MATDEIESYARASNLKLMGSRPPLGEYIIETWKRKGFAWTLAVLNKTAENASSRFGIWWIVLVPILQSIIFGMIIGLLLGRLRDPAFIPYLFTGVFLYTFVSSVFQAGASSITGNQGLLKSINFPRMIMPMSELFKHFLGFLPSIPILILFVAIFTQSFKWQIVFFPLIVALLTVFGFGLALVAARLTVDVSEIGSVIPFITRLGFYASGVFFHPSHIGGNSEVFTVIMNANPIYCYLMLARGTLVPGYELETIHWVIALCWTFGLLFFGVIYFWRAEERYVIE
jgi:teichoic acid transport system permease protein